MSRIRNYILLSVAAFALSGCTAVQEIAQMTVDDIRGGSTFGFSKQDPAHQWVEDPAAEQSWQPNDNVQVYNYDVASQEGDQGDYARQAHYQQAPDFDNRPVELSYDDPIQTVSPYDPSVTVYPIGDDGMGSYEMAETPVQQYYPAPIEAQPSMSYDAIPVASDNIFGGGVTPMPYDMPTGAQPASIYYKHGVTSLGASGRKVVDNVAGHYRSNPSVPLQVEGYASIRAQTKDPVKREILNLKTSMDRAINVSQELIKKGVPATSIRTIAYGDTRPAASHSGVSVEDASRRVEIYTKPSSY